MSKAWELIRQHIALNRAIVVQKDAIDLMRLLPAASIDLIVTDPAYESLEKHRRGGTTNRLMKSNRSSNEWFPIFRNDRFPELLDQMYRVLKPNSHAYIQCDEDTSDIVKPLARTAGFKVWKRLIWDKQRIGMGYHWRNQTEFIIWMQKQVDEAEGEEGHEFILFMEKGRRRLNRLGWPNVLYAKRISGADIYPTEKPESIYEQLILNSSDRGDIVLDCSCGSGASGAASIRHGRLWIGCDVAPAAIVRSRRRILAELETICFCGCQIASHDTTTAGPNGSCLTEGCDCTAYRSREYEDV